MNKWLNYYHPSTVAFVDDQQAFLSALQNRLPPDTLALFFNDPEIALSRIIEDSSLQNQNPQYINEIPDDLEVDLQNTNEAFFSLKLADACKSSYNPKRFSRISVVVVDQMMPDLDGISLCRKLTGHPIKKIMLTASKDQQVAIDAFNEGIIDYFLLKDSPNLVSQLMTVIDQMQKDYFSSLAKLTLGNTLDVAAPLLNNGSMIDFLQAQMNEIGAVEFYLLDKLGSILFIKYDGTPVTLAMSSEDCIESYAAIAEENEEKSISDALYKKEKLLFFPNEKDCMRPVSDWDNFLFEATPLPGQEKLFYTIIKDVQHQPVNIEKIQSQLSYMQN